MEKIKQALDRARKERGETSGKKVDLDEANSPVKYAETQSIKGSSKKMQESKISTALGHDE